MRKINKVLLMAWILLINIPLIKAIGEYSQADGGVVLPTNLQVFFQEIYYGTLLYFSKILLPLLIIIIIVFVALIIIGIGSLIKRISSFR